MRKLILGLCVSAVLAIGAAAPAFAGPPVPSENQGITRACEVAADQALAPRGPLPCL